MEIAADCFLDLLRHRRSEPGHQLLNPLVRALEHRTTRTDSTAQVENRVSNELVRAHQLDREVVLQEMAAGAGATEAAQGQTRIIHDDAPAQVPCPAQERVLDDHPFRRHADGIVAGAET